jgi:threonine/homoserine/homoserine lactone efflux protein
MTVALGMALGAGVWGLAGFFSVHALFTAAPWLYLILKLLGAAYLIWLGAVVVG